MSATIEQVSNKKFDFIVVGGGTAGLVVATRLTEDPSVTVLVLESGAANLQDPALLTPAAFGSHFGNPQYDWAFRTVPQKNSGGYVTNWERGKGLGGSSAINFFQYHRPAKSDIDAFEELGNPGWNWDLLKKYYMKVETFVPPSNKTEVMSYDLKDRGSNGPLRVAYPSTLSGFEQPYHEALASMGINRAREPFSGDTKGTWLTPITVDPIIRARSYAANKYYEPNAARANLVVLTLAHVAKINVSKSPSGEVTATGVSFLYEGKVHQAEVGKEVILAAGAIISPQILELSGIGDKDILTKLGIETKLDLPGVGKNVQEHMYCGASYEVRDDRASEFLTFDCLRDPQELVKQIELYQKTGTGAFGMSSACMTFVPLLAISEDAREIQAKLSNTIQAGIEAGKYSPALKKQFDIQLQHIKDQEPSCEMVCTQAFGSRPKLPLPGKKYLTLTAHVNHPFSRGSIHAKSTDPLEHPELDPHYFEEEYDLTMFVETIKFNRRLAQREPFKSILTGTEVNPGPEVQTDEQIADFLKANLLTGYHTVGSCSMLPLEDGGVVDPKLKVYNTSNLRIVDLSIVPLHIGAHMQATAYAIGELAADIIKGVV
ncbi:alcohol oxidase [Artomyces pyxidatus]|uniref:Alcohol oxidase n=1 Tax=Artomyces pyxidatus TaxID=48021 RepID=A0ACB8TDW5_9AGAM|nr:alcohol oxidase [Artomyces pyxidatus]